MPNLTENNLSNGKFFSPRRAVLQVRAHARLGRILQVSVAAVAHVHQGRKGSAHGRRHFAVQIVDGGIEEADVRRVLGLDVVVVVVVGEVVPAAAGTDPDVEQAGSRSRDRVVRRVVVVSAADRFSVLYENRNSYSSRRTLGRLDNQERLKSIK